MDLAGAAKLIQEFERGDLGRRISEAQWALEGVRSEGVAEALDRLDVRESGLAAALVLKQAAGQVNVLVHAIGILLSLPAILEPGEEIAFLSLGAGSTGKLFDLETDRRIAEFKFIAWRGGAEAIRQNQLFKDFFLLAEAQTTKRKQLFVTGSHYPLKFLHGGRALGSVLSRNVKLGATFRDRFGERYATVREYYRDHAHAVEIVDLDQLFPGRFSALEDVVPET